jgi:DNA-binding LacI/PurR family transcriptional regulator
VSQDAEHQAQYAVDAAVDRLEQRRTVATEIVVEPHLVVRRTTQQPPTGS